MEKNIDFYDIYDYYAQPIWQTNSFKITVLILGLIVIGIITFFITRFLIRRKKNLSLLPWQWAFEKLQKLSPQNCSSKKDFKNFYFDLTDIIKNYLNKRYGWKILDKTDIELIKYLENEKFDKNLLQNLQKMTDSILWIKFANEDAIKNQVENDLKLAYEIVEQTKESENSSSDKHAKNKK